MQNSFFSHTSQKYRKSVCIMQRDVFLCMTSIILEIYFVVIRLGCINVVNCEKILILWIKQKRENYVDFQNKLSQIYRKRVLISFLSASKFHKIIIHFGYLNESMKLILKCILTIYGVKLFCCIRYTKGIRYQVLSGSEVTPSQ